MLALIAGTFLIGQVLSIVVLALLQPDLFQPDLFGSRLPMLSRLLPVPTILASAAAEIPIFIAVLIGLPRATRVSLRDLGFVRPNLRAIGIALASVVAGVALATVGSNVVSAVTHTGDHAQATEKMFLQMHVPWQIALFAVFAVVLGPIVEETLFRAFAFNAVLRYGGFWTAAVVSSILFGLAHGDPFNALPLALVGMVLCGVYYLTRNVVASMIAHGAFNLLSLIALLFFPQMAGH